MPSNKSDAYAGWDTEGHLKTFDGWNGQSDAHFKFAYGCFSEQIYLNQAVRALKNPLILDVGCATGTTYRFLKNTNADNSFQYRGVDLSGPAIERARKLYPGVQFSQKGHEPLREFFGATADIVYSRDTVLHQTEPFAFLTELISVAGRFLVLRLRTRDHGATEWNVDVSCQMHYDRYWMPYIVINTDELIAFLKTFPRIKRLTFNRSYEVLGGQNYRYLPKDLYLTSAGAAETSLLIEFAQTESGGEPDIVFDNSLQGHAFLRRHRARRYAHALLSFAKRKLVAPSPT